MNIKYAEDIVRASMLVDQMRNDLEACNLLPDDLATAVQARLNIVAIAARTLAKRIDTLRETMKSDDDNSHAAVTD